MKTIIARDSDLETHGIFTKVIRIFALPLINNIPSRLLRNLMHLTSNDARTVVGNTGSAIALEAMYTRHHRGIFSRGVLEGIADLFWHHAISQPKALRNRLKLVEKNVEEEILRTDKNSIKILSLGGGSARALIHSLKKLSDKGLDKKVEVVNIDMDKRALDLGQRLAMDTGLRAYFSWIKDDLRNLRKYVSDESVDIVEMVGLLDYFSEEKSVDIMNSIKDVLKKNGMFIFANVHPNKEMPFVDHLGWPAMYYRKPQELASILNKAGFLNEPDIILEPLEVHLIVKIRK